MTERIPVHTGINYKIGRTSFDGASTTDWMEQEKERGIKLRPPPLHLFLER